MAAASRSRSERSLDLLCASSARLKMSMAKASNSSTASSSAVASSVWNKAARVAVRRGGAVANFANGRRGEFGRGRGESVSDFKGRHFEGEIVLWAVRW